MVAATLLALSPVLLYYSRFARNDLPFALFTTLLVASVWRYREQGGEGARGAAGRIRGGGWLLLAAAALALSFTTKETAYLTAAMMLLYLDASVAWGLVPERLRGGRRLLCWAALLPAAWVLVALWPLAGALRRRWGLGPWSPDCDLLVVVGTLTATQVGAFALIPAEAWWGELSGDRARTFSGAVLLLLVGGSAAVGLLWSRWWLLPALLFFAIYVPLYTTFGTNPPGPPLPASGARSTTGSRSRRCSAGTSRASTTPSWCPSTSRSRSGRRSRAAPGSSRAGTASRGCSAGGSPGCSSRSPSPARRCRGSPSTSRSR